MLFPLYFIISITAVKRLSPAANFPELPTVFNSADEAAVEFFLSGKISYPEISEAIQRAMETIPVKSNPSLADIFETDRQARETVYRNYWEK